MNQYNLKPEHKEFLLTKIPDSNSRFSVKVIKKNAKHIQEFFTSTGFNKNEWPYSQSELDYLISKKILFLIEEEGIYLLTYKGLTILEYNLIFSTEFDCYLNDLNSELFYKIMKTKSEPLKPKEKAILFTVIGLYAFSPNHSLVVDESNKSELVKSTDIAVELLKKYFSQDSSEFDEIWDSKAVGETSILSKLRRFNEIPPKTGNIFKIPRSKEIGIYVDILSEDGSINENKVMFLLKKIFDNIIFDKDQKQEIIDTFNNIQKGHFSLIKSKTKVNKIGIKIELQDIILEKL